MFSETPSRASGTHEIDTRELLPSTLVGVDQELPFQFMALPALSTAMQKVEPVQDKAAIGDPSMPEPKPLQEPAEPVQM